MNTSSIFAKSNLGPGLLNHGLWDHGKRREGMPTSSMTSSSQSGMSPRKQLSLNHTVYKTKNRNRNDLSRTDLAEQPPFLYFKQMFRHPKHFFRFGDLVKEGQPPTDERD
jgi:hypothetical protein